MARDVSTTIACDGSSPVFLLVRASPRAKAPQDPPDFQGIPEQTAIPERLAMPALRVSPEARRHG